MTTNVYDGGAFVFCSDSRWSFTIKGMGEETHAILYVDDTDFDKIEPQEDFSFIFAGSSLLIDEWKKWIRSPSRSVISRPQIADDFAVCMAETKTGAIKFEHGQKISGSDHRFAGTGAYSAYKCWNANRNASKCVASAYIHDIYSGGQVKFLDMRNYSHNVNPNGSYDSINKLALVKGMVMYKSTEKAVAINDAVLKDPILKDFAEKVANGSAFAEAPSGRDKIVWTDADVTRLDKALAECFGIVKR